MKEQRRNLFRKKENKEYKILFCNINLARTNWLKSGDKKDSILLKSVIKKTQNINI